MKTAVETLEQRIKEFDIIPLDKTEILISRSDLTKLINLAKNDVKNSELWNQLNEGLERKQLLLIEQVNELKNVNYNIDLIYLKNDELKLEDSKL
jgi:hypothetical protein